MDLRLGKTPATHDRRDLLMARYTKDVALPLLPTTDLGHQGLVPTWGMLGNDAYGDCVWAGAAHETMLWTAEGSAAVPFTEPVVLSDYSAVTGFKTSDPNTDQGTNMRDAMNYRVKTGVLDAAGKRHKIGAYVAITPGDVTQLKTSIYLFSSAAVGIEFPGSAMDQFNAGKPWTVVKGASVEGGHYVPVVGYLVKQDMFVCVTWGKAQLVAPTFLKKYMDEGYAALSAEFLRAGMSPEGFDTAALTEDVAELGGKPAPTPTPIPTPTPTPTADNVSRAAAVAALKALPGV